MTAVVTPDGDRRWRVDCEGCHLGISRSSRPPLVKLADEHNRTYHPAPGGPDSNAKTTYVSVEDTPDWGVPADGSVTVQFRSGGYVRRVQLSREAARDLHNHLTYYLKQGAK